jgi:hypothetical protein
MDYGRLLREAWRITWRHPFLWVLGLFAGGTAGISLGGGGGGPSDPGRGRIPPAGVDIGPEHMVQWATAHGGLIAAVVGLVALIALALLIVSLIAQGGLAGATADFASGRSSSLGRAWRTGRHLFWRYAGLWLLLALAVAVFGALVAGFVALVIGLVLWTRNTVLVIAPAVLVGLLLLVTGVAAGVVVSIVVPYAQRAIAVRDVGPLAGLRDGWDVLRSHPGACLLVWLLNLALSFGAGLIITAAMVVTIVALALPAMALWATFELSTPTIVYLSLAGFVALTVLLTLISVANTFFWSYWTLAYLRLTTGPPPT